jgi:hypothetical protein
MQPWPKRIGMVGPAVSWAGSLVNCCVMHHVDDSEAARTRQVSYSTLVAGFPDHWNQGPVCGCQTGTKRPVLYAKQDQVYPIVSYCGGDQVPACKLFGVDQPCGARRTGCRRQSWCGTAANRRCRLHAARPRQPRGVAGGRLLHRHPRHSAAGPADLRQAHAAGGTQIAVKIRSRVKGVELHFHHAFNFRQ